MTRTENSQSRISRNEKVVCYQTLESEARAFSSSQDFKDFFASALNSFTALTLCLTTAPSAVAVNGGDLK